MDKHSSEQQFCKSDVSTFAVQKVWNHAASTTESYDRLAGRLNMGKFQIFKIHYGSKF